jgi:Sec-independent protein translocase protein TatA
MKIFDDNSFGWAIVVVALLVLGAQVIRGVMKWWIV